MKFFPIFFVSLLGILGGIHFISDTKPVRFFHESETQYSTIEIKNMVNKYGKNIIIGGDEGYGESFRKTMRDVDAYQAFKHVYIVGPGLWKWSTEEQDQIRNMAKKNGIDTNLPSWKKNWYTFGWILEVKERFRYYDKLGFYSIEIDNLDTVLKTPQSFIDFYEQFDQFLIKEEINVKLVIKNLDEETLKALIFAVQAGAIRQNMFAPVGMFEKDSGKPSEQIRLAKKLGITAITPISGLRPTENYGTIKEGVPIGSK